MKTFKGILLNTFIERKIYMFNTVMSVLLGFIPVLVMIFLWNAIYKSGLKIDDFNKNSIITYFFLVYIVSNITEASNIARKISGDIRSGAINNILIKPINHLKYTFLLYLSDKIIDTIITIIPSIVFAFLARKYITINLHKMVPFLLALIIGCILNFLIYYIIGLSSFWSINNGGIIQLWNNLIAIVSGNKFPISFLPIFFQKILILLPFEYTVYLPISILLGKTLSVTTIMIEFCWIIVMYILSKIIWKKGVALNEGVGM
ncbi:hypothetical protein CLTEP_11510 [Clostridium tepidiprofundi DSM 19306]|uniref:ABC-2 family transporter protein n=1 Tax=Clostridium tepidiprofundi DSM 19306 TaxID=1121338 RepID=A0A151B4M0_9CLOT|nr:ABC-2 family transporter protein [Clostridium tepidiprofundi]KYH34836.1 hypothetical protein CLTEP_11510 [Clostridium tepidiprofundi DSM 19306]